LRRFLLLAVLFAGGVALLHGGLRAVGRGIALLRRQQHGRNEEKQEDGEDETGAHQTAHPRMRSAARRASDSASRTTLSRASFTSAARRADASATCCCACACVRETSSLRNVAASARNWSRRLPASRLAT